MSFTFVDLFAGIGGFHAALSAAGGTCVLASEIDQEASAVYALNWGAGVRRTPPSAPAVAGDINLLAPEDGKVLVPKHDVLAAGFPCQPFSKSGAQMGVRDKTRGTLFHRILRILDERRPKIVFLENVRNLAGPRHEDTFKTIIDALRDIGYKVSAEPCVFSPHFLPPWQGGSPQIRDRVFILGVYVGRERALAETDVAPVVDRQPVDGWDPQMWDLASTALPALGGIPLLQADSDIEHLERYQLSASETKWITAWDDFVSRALEAREGAPLPGFPLWADHFVPSDEVVIDDDTPAWKADFLRKNSRFYEEHQCMVDAWLEDWDYLADFPASRRKLEWQAQQMGSLWDCVIHLRPSGIRAKKPSYVPALVAITQTSIIGPRRRRLTPREAARLQGLPDWFDFGEQGDPATYKQLGNGVNVGAIYFAFREFVRQNRHELPRSLASEILEREDVPHVVAHEEPPSADEKLDLGATVSI